MRFATQATTHVKWRFRERETSDENLRFCEIKYEWKNVNKMRNKNRNEVDEKYEKKEVVLIKCSWNIVNEIRTQDQQKFSIIL